MTLEKTNINTPVTKEQRKRLNEVASSFNMKQSELVRDTLDNFLPIDPIPEHFVKMIDINFLLKKGAPIRTIVPYITSKLGYVMYGEWTIKNGQGQTFTLNPFPEYSHLCAIRIVEQIYKQYRTA